VQFFPMLERTLRTPFSPPATRNAVFDAAFAKMRKYDLALFTAGFLMSPRGSHPQGEDFPDFFRDMKLNDYATADILAYPFAFRLINGVSFVETQVAGQRMRNPQQIIDAVEDETLKVELILHYLGNVRDMMSFEIWKERFGKHFNTDELKARFDAHGTRIARLVEDAASQQGAAAPSTPREERPGLTEGAPAPNFTYNDVDGNPVSLSDFKGKVVYIDVWATWCGPCRRELPHLAALKERFKDNENIAIIAISTDADAQRWRDFVAAENLGGIQLHGRTNDESDIARLYHVSTLPRFFLIDKEGNVVSNNAPRPSSEDIIPMLERLLR
jgi:thiol-disulfide isomerase/thioredoxin